MKSHPFLDEIRSRPDVRVLEVKGEEVLEEVKGWLAEQMEKGEKSWGP